MSSLHVNIDRQVSICLDPLPKRESVLMSFESAVHGLTQNCAVLPVARIDAVIEALRLARDQAKPA